MQPLRIIVPGSFWDSFVYEGRLYLFGRDGSLRTINWDGLIDSWPIVQRLQLAFRCAFRRSDYLYLRDVQDLLRNPDVRTLVTSQFESLENEQLEVSDKQIATNALGIQDNPSPFPHADLEIYGRNLYTGTTSGLYRITCNRRTRRPVGTRREKKWDGAVLALAASYNIIAIAAGNDGLHELNLDPYASDVDDDTTQTSQIACRDCNWMYYSVFASSERSGYLADYRKVPDSDSEYGTRRQLMRVARARDLFGIDGFSWGAQDKVFQAQGGQLRVIRYTPWAANEEEQLQELEPLRFAPWKGDVIAASAAPFGTVVELEHALVVLPSVGMPVTIPVEPINWRVFPRSLHFENQLHVVFEDRLEVLSFNHDYLVDQDTKVLGTRVIIDKPRHRRPGRR